MKTISAALVASLATASHAWPAPPSSGSCNPRDGEVGAVFAMTNIASGNSVVSFSRDASGHLTQNGIFPTGGHGIGVDFDTQGGLQLSKDKRFLYGVNPGDDKISVFSVHGSCLKCVQEIYGGDQPLSIALNGDLAYVLDGSVADTGIRGFKVGSDGLLTPIGNSTIPTSTPIGVPGSIAFSPDGKALVVTNKVGSTIDLYTVDSDGKATLSTTSQSAGLRPFAATFRSDGKLFVIESGLPVLTNAAVSTYDVDESSGALHVITHSEKNQQTDGCWIVFAGGEKYAYTANFVSSTISSYSVDPSGSVKLLNGTAASPGAKSEPVDLALSKDGKILYNLLRGEGAVTGWTINDDGSLTSLGVFGKGQGLPFNNGASGLAAY